MKTKLIILTFFGFLSWSFLNKTESKASQDKEEHLKVLPKEYDGKIRRCRIRKVYRPRRDLYVVVGIVRGDVTQEAQYMQMEFLKPFDEGVPVPETIICELKSYNAEKQRSRFVNRRELSFEGEVSDVEYKVKCTALNKDKKPIGTPVTFSVFVEDPADEE
jgi:hypothetical protein